MLLGRCRKYLGLGQKLFPAGNDSLQFLVVLQEVYLVYHQEHRNSLLGYLCQKIGVLRRIFDNVGHIEQHVGIGKRALAKCQHALLHFIFRLQHAGSVGKNYLITGSIDDAHYAVTGRLRLFCYNADTFADKIVHQRRFADIGIAYYVYETRTVGSHFGKIFFVGRAKNRRWLFSFFHEVIIQLDVSI